MSIPSVRGSRPLPSRYEQTAWEIPFTAALAPSLTPGARILDIGSGRRPAIPQASRPSGCTYVGLDLSLAELERAPEGSYDEVLVGDVQDRRDDLEGRFDLVVSWQVLEHVKPLSGALENIRFYLRPGGRFVGQLSGALSLMAVANMIIPNSAARWVLHRLLGRDPTSVFPAYYDKCWYSALGELGRTWSSFSIIPRHAGAVYFSFAPLAQRLYLRYEEWTIRTDRRNLASHYLLIGER